MKERNIHPTIETASYELSTGSLIGCESLCLMDDYFKAVLEFYQCVPRWYEIENPMKYKIILKESLCTAYQELKVDMLNINMSGMFFGKDKFGMNYKHFKFFTVEQTVHEREHSFLLEHRVVAKV